MIEYKTRQGDLVVPDPFTQFFNKPKNWTILNHSVYKNPSIWTRLFGLVYLDPSIETCLLGPVYLDLSL